MGTEQSHKAVRSSGPVILPFNRKNRIVEVSPKTGYIREAPHTPMSIPSQARTANKHAWLKDIQRENPTVLAHLAAENATTDQIFAPLTPLQTTLLAEYTTRAKIDRRTRDVIDGEYAYYEEFDATASQPRHMRRHTPSNTIETLLDEDTLAHGDYCDVGDITVSDDHTRLAWTEDRQGNEEYTLYVKDLATSTLLATITDTAAEVIFSSDGTQIVYLTLDHAHRPHQVWSYNIPTQTATLLFQENDERFWLSTTVTRDEKWVVIDSTSSQTTSEHILVERTHLTNPTVFTSRTEGIYTDLDAYDDTFWIISNHRRKDNELFTAQHGQSAHQWTPVYTPEEGTFLNNIEIFAQHIAFDMRYNGFNRVAVAKRNNTTIGSLTWLESTTDASTTTLSENPMPNSPYLSIEHHTWTTPTTTIRYRLEHETGPTPVSARTIEHTEYIPEYTPDLYDSTLSWATSPDGTSIPYSIIQRIDTPVRGAQLWAYGSYGVTEDPSLVSTWISLLDRGIACVIAYPRGGGELGREWYDKGKLTHKQNTFDDMEAIARALHLNGYAPLVLRGGSAGGLMVGATINQAPELFVAAVAEVPFVDVLSTMLDSTLPLTVGEYEEWGNPEDPDVYNRIEAYSPIDNVRVANYPAIYATAGLHDPRVGYWEPAQWVLTLREHTTSNKPILLRCEMAGHGGSTGRWDQYSEKAEAMAFIITHIETSQTTTRSIA